MNTDKKCYMCDCPANTREHVPPLCLFPEKKDFKGLDFRKDLITVPSCDKHNSKKSKDDEFLLFSIAGIVGNNSLGYLQTKTKIFRAIKRKGETFLKEAVIKNSKDLIINSKEGIEFPVLLGNPDYDRLIKCFENIAYGLYFHENKKTFKGEIRTHLGFLKYQDQDSNTLISFLKKSFAIKKLALDVKGNNPKVFKYQFCLPDKFGLIALKLTFYEATEVFISFLPEGKKEPFDFSMYLLNKGLPITFTLGDEEFAFNKNDTPSSPEAVTIEQK